jgi:hypothetical protein
MAHVLGRSHTNKAFAPRSVSLCSVNSQRVLSTHMLSHVALPCRAMVTRAVKGASVTKDVIGALLGALIGYAVMPPAIAYHSLHLLPSHTVSCHAVLCLAVPICNPGQELDIDLLVCRDCRSNSISVGGKISQGVLQPRCRECPFGTPANGAATACQQGELHT